MNKEKVNENMEKAYEAIAKTGICQNGVIKKTFRGQVSTFGAAVSMGSLLPAIAFFSDNGSSSVERRKITEAIYMIIKPEAAGNVKDAALYMYAKQQINDKKEESCKEEILNAAIALKLAMNLYKLEK